MTDDVAEASPRPDAPPPRNKGGRPKSDTITLTKQARDRFNRKVVQNIDTLFDALFDAATKDGDVNAARLLIDRAIPSRRGAPIHFPLRPLKTAQDCAEVLSDLLTSVAEGRLTPDEASQLSGIVSKRAELFASVQVFQVLAQTDWRGWRGWEGMNMPRPELLRSDFFGACRAEFPISALGRSSSSPPISFIPSTIAKSSPRAEGRWGNAKREGRRSMIAAL